MERIPDVEELRAFLYRMLREARLMGDEARVDDLLDKLADVGGQQAFLQCVLGS